MSRVPPQEFERGDFSTVVPVTATDIAAAGDDDADPSLASPQGAGMVTVVEERLDDADLLFSTKASEPPSASEKLERKERSEFHNG